jgi:hypothetical protein
LKEERRGWRNEMMARGKDEEIRGREKGMDDRNEGEREG